jgi:hypothetical protein
VGVLHGVREDRRESERSLQSSKEWEDVVMVLMTKFGKSEKIRLSGLLFRNIRFWRFQSEANEETKFKDLNIQGALKQEKGLKGIMGPR